LVPAATKTASISRQHRLRASSNASDCPLVLPDLGRSFTFVISTPAVDRSGDTVAIDGWQLGNYAKNPVVLWSHDGRLLPIGRTTKLWADGNRLKATFELAPATANADAENVRELIAGDYLRAASVGFLPIKFSFSDAPDRKFGIDFSRQELIEWSIVATPANPECLIDRAPAARSGRASLGTSEAAARHQRDNARRRRDSVIAALRAKA